MILTKSFTLEEMYRSDVADSNNINNKPSLMIQSRLLQLCKNCLQPLRDAWGAPIIVNSGYRCPAVNNLVGGSKTSDHVKGFAADIRAKDKKDNKELFDLAVAMMKKGRLRNVKQIIDEYNYSWVHISINPDRDGKHNQVLHLG